MRDSESNFQLSEKASHYFSESTKALKLKQYLALSNDRSDKFLSKCLLSDFAEVQHQPVASNVLQAKMPFTANLSVRCKTRDSSRNEQPKYRRDSKNK